jgi:hypothetical protein
MQSSNFINPPINIVSIDGECSGCMVVIVIAPNIDDISVLWEDGIANVHCHAIAAIAAIAAVAAALAADNVTAVAVALTSTITIATAAANITAAVVIATAATTAAVVGGVYQRHHWDKV